MLNELLQILLRSAELNEDDSSDYIYLSVETHRLLALICPHTNEPYMWHAVEHPFHYDGKDKLHIEVMAGWFYRAASILIEENSK